MADNINNGIWVFLSHSNKDYDKVRTVRNILEEHGFRPLMFFLKCLDDDKNDDEVRHLIQREIDSRNRFILCDSPNAQASDWVKEEVSYIQSKQRFYQTIDLKDVDDPEKLAESILLFKKRSTVLLSSSKYDSETAKALIGHLQSSDFMITDLHDSLTIDDYASNDLAETIKKNIDEGGYYIALISNRFTESLWCMKELQFAIDCQKKSGYRIILPIQIEKITSIPHSLTSVLNGMEIQDAYSNVINEFAADVWTKNHSLSPNQRIAFNIMDILYWEDMKKEFLISNKSNHTKAWEYFMNGRRLFFDDRNYEGIEHAAAMEFMRAAYLGHVGAMRYLAECYNEGWGVIKDMHKANELAKKASHNYAVYVCNDRRDYDSKYIRWIMNDMNISYIYWKDLEPYELEYKVADSIAQSKLFLFIASRQSISNNNILNQLNIAITNNIRVIVVKMGEVELSHVSRIIENADIVTYNPHGSGAIKTLLSNYQLSMW